VLPARAQIRTRLVAFLALDLVNNLKVMRDELLKVCNGAECPFLSCWLFDMALAEREELPGQGTLCIDESLLGWLSAIDAWKHWCEAECIWCHTCTFLASVCC